MSQTSLFDTDPSRPLTPKTAREVIAGNPKIKATVTEGEQFPLYNHEDSRVRLFEKVKDAETYLRRRMEALSELGYTKEWGTLQRGAFQFDKGDSKVGVVLEKRKRETK